MTENKIKKIMLDLGKNARTAAHSVGTLDTKIKNDILFDASENLMKNKKKYWMQILLILKKINQS